MYSEVGACFSCDGAFSMSLPIIAGIDYSPFTGKIPAFTGNLFVLTYVQFPTCRWLAILVA